jgi:glycosyltransferase involved in cell wall biosynthesis
MQPAADKLGALNDARAAPLVSIIVPSYNHARYLREAIDSILAQDYPKIELIVIDDGSTDGSPEILRGYGKRFHWELQTNQGQVATLNRGWMMSRGDILGYLSADDLLLERAVSNAVRCLGDNPDSVLAYCDFNLVDPNSAVVRRVRAPEFDYRRMVVDIECPPGPGAFFRRQAFEKAGTWNTQFKQMLDYEYWLRLGLHGRFVRIPEVLAAYRVHPGSQSFAASHQIRPEEPIRIIERYFENANVPNEIRQARDQALGTAHLIAAQLFLKTGKYGQAAGMALRAFRLKPGSLVSPRTLRMLLNALFNRLAHRVLWTLRRAFRAPASRAADK